jgi:hypothetical protein
MGDFEHLTPIFDVLRRRRPDLTASLIRQYPELKGPLEGRRTLGEADAKLPDKAVAGELMKAALLEAKADLNEVLAVLSRRARLLARLRLGAGAISALSSAGVVAALVVGKDARAQLITALVAFLASLTGLVSIYIEDFSGGDGSIRRLKESMSTQVRQLSEVEGQFRLAVAFDDVTKIVSGLTVVNGVLGQVQFARAQLALKI